VIVPVATVFMVVAWTSWTWAVWHDRRRVDLVRGRWTALGVGVLLVGFSVFRNLPVGGWFAAGLSG
jgi:hypothetical protein